MKFSHPKASTAVTILGHTILFQLVTFLQFSNRVHYLSPEEFLYTFSQRSRYTQRLEKFSNAEEPLRRSILNQ
jgi:hypothetical protein